VLTASSQPHDYEAALVQTPVRPLAIVISASRVGHDSLGIQLLHAVLAMIFSISDATLAIASFSI